jgi:PAS domain S-box-containing protein
VKIFMKISDLRLMYRGLLLAALPIAVQLLLVTGLVALLFQAQYQVEREAHSKEVIAQSLISTMMIGDVVLSITIYQKAMGLMKRSFLDKKIEIGLAQMDRMEDLLSQDPGQKENLALLRQVVPNMWDVVQQQLDHPDRDFVNQRDSKFIAEATKFFTLSSDVVNVETRDREKGSQLKILWRTAIRVCLGLAVFASIGLAVLLARYYATGIRQPLMNLSENSRLLSQRLPLKPQREGKDEFAALDRTLHDVDAAIGAALERERALLENAADLICSIDKNGVFKKVNPFASRLLGLAPEELIGTSAVSCVTESDQAKFVEEFRQALSGEARNFEIRLQPRGRAKGAGTDFSPSNQPIQPIDTLWSTLYSEREQQLFCVVHDITERKNVDRLKQDFIAMISHDLRSPLTSVMGALSMLLEGVKGELSPQAKKELAQSESNLQRLIELVNDLLDFEKLQAGKMQFELAPCSLNQITQQACQLVSALAQERKVNLKVPSTDVEVVADASKLVRVILNYLSNALKYAPAESLVTIDISERDGEVELSVSDQGPGMPAQYQEVIFAPFEQVPGEHSAKHGGTGLGLAICKLVVEGHGGTVGVRDNVSGKGTTFWFCLPLTPAKKTEGETLSVGLAPVSPKS